MWKNFYAKTSMSNFQCINPHGLQKLPFCRSYWSYLYVQYNESFSVELVLGTLLFLRLRAMMPVDDFDKLYKFLDLQKQEVQLSSILITLWCTVHESKYTKSHIISSE